MTTDTDNHASADDAPDVAKKSPIAQRLTFLKFYGIAYVILLILFGIHAFNGRTEIPVADAKAGQRVWGEFSYVRTSNNAQGQSVTSHIELAPGTALSDLDIPAIASAFRSEPKASIGIYRDGFLYHLPWHSIFTIWNFLGVVLCLYVIMGDMLPQALDKHSRTMSEELEIARAAVAEANRIHKRHEQLQGEMEAEAQRLATVAAQDSVREKERIITEAKADAKRLLESTRALLATEVNAAAARLRGEIADAAIEMARQAVIEQVDDEADATIVARFTEALKEQEIA